MASKKREKRERKEREIERKGGKKREKRCPGSIIINLHSILKKKKTKYIGRNA